jgi:hypothetical protein
MFGIRQDPISAALTTQPPSIENGDVPLLVSQSQSRNILPPPPPMGPTQLDTAPGVDVALHIMEPKSQDIVPESEHGDPDIVPSSWNTEENAVASSGDRV